MIITLGCSLYSPGLVLSSFPFSVSYHIIHIHINTNNDPSFYSSPRLHTLYTINALYTRTIHTTHTIHTYTPYTLYALYNIKLHTLYTCIHHTYYTHIHRGAMRQKQSRRRLTVKSTFPRQRTSSRTSHRRSSETWPSCR